MRKVITSIIIMILSYFVVYLPIAFTIMEFNLSLMGETCRGAIALWGTCIGLYAIVIYLKNK